MDAMQDDSNHPPCADRARARRFDKSEPMHPPDAMEVQICMAAAKEVEHCKHIERLENQANANIMKMDRLAQGLAAAQTKIAANEEKLKSLQDEVKTARAERDRMQRLLDDLKTVSRAHHNKIKHKFEALKVCAAAQREADVHCANIASSPSGEILLNLIGDVLWKVTKVWEVLGMDIVSQSMAVDPVVTVDKEGRAQVWSENSLQEYCAKFESTERVQDPCSRRPLMGTYRLYPARSGLESCTAEFRTTVLALAKTAREMGLAENQALNSFLQALDILEFTSDGPQMPSMPDELMQSPRSDCDSVSFPATPVTPGRWD